MRVIKRNKKHLGTECPHCGSILKISPQDISTRRVEQRDSSDRVIRDGVVYTFREVTIYKTVSCCVCKNDLYVDIENKKTYESY